jgi:two-component system, OmpR family, response regulator RegX3
MAPGRRPRTVRAMSDQAEAVQPGPRARILVVEDEPSIADPFAAALEREGFDPRVAPTAAAARERFGAEAFDLVVLDLTLPDADGRDLCRELRRSSDVPILMLTARGTEVDRIVGLELGADDYVVKPFSAAEVAARIRAILRRTGREGPPLPERLRAGDLEIEVGARRVRQAGRELHLSRKEFDLLARLVRDRGHVVTREALISDVWDENWFGSTRTLDVHVGWLRRKLGDSSVQPRYIHTVRGIGFRFASSVELERCA